MSNWNNLGRGKYTLGDWTIEREFTGDPVKKGLVYWVISGPGVPVGWEAPSAPTFREARLKAETMIAEKLSRTSQT